ncbi:uncharacterized protein METZ01_LOCUS297134, partial [marine metagenome]
SGLPFVDPRPVLDNLIITGNTSNGGSAIYSYTGHEFSIKNSEIKNNYYVPDSPINNSGIAIFASTLTVDRVLIRESYGAAIDAKYGSNAMVINSVIVNNEYGLAANHNSSINVYNSILYSNSTDGGAGYTDENSSITVQYSNVEGGFDGDSNINSDPLFTDAEDGDFTLQSTSPCIDAGTADIDGDGNEDISNYFGTAPDMGAYEFYLAVTGLQYTIENASVILDWDPIVDAEFYKIERSIDAEFTTDVEPSVLQTNTHTDIDLEWDTEYFYRVSAYVSGLWADYSNVLSVTLEYVNIAGANDIPTVYKVHQNHPNPFNPVTTLRYELPQDAMVNITIYDMMGRQVNSLVNGSQTAGYRTIQWNAANDRNEPVSAGLYLYTIEAGKFR